MAKQDLVNNIKVAAAFDTQSITTDTTTAGDVVDTQGFESVTFIVKAGALNAGTFTPLIEDADESAFNVTNAAVADAYLIGTEAGAALTDAQDHDSVKIGYIGKKRYVRLSIVSSGASGANTLSGVCILGHPTNAPQSTQRVAD